MKALEERILNDGTVLPGEVLKVSSFFNVNIDTGLMMDMGREIARLYSGCSVTKILTVEASGIALALASANYLGVPFVFAKKHASDNIVGDMYISRVHSYTHGNDNNIVVPAEFISSRDRVLIVDDFLALGNALRGMIDIVSQSGAELVGCAVGIEKGYQGGGDEFRNKGIRVESLALVDSMKDGKITFR